MDCRGGCRGERTELAWREQVKLFPGGVASQKMALRELALKRYLPRKWFPRMTSPEVSSQRTWWEQPRNFKRYIMPSCAQASFKIGVCIPVLTVYVFQGINWICCLYFPFGVLSLAETKGSSGFHIGCICSLGVFCVPRTYQYNFRT